jgi:hypothetical protein
VCAKVGPRGLEFARYSLDYHTVRNFLYTKRAFGDRADQHVPKFAKLLVEKYNGNGAVDKLLKPQLNKQPFDVVGGVRWSDASSTTPPWAPVVGAAVLGVLLLLAGLNVVAGAGLPSP